MYKKINKCRICGNPDLASIIDLGKQYLTGVFPKSKKERVAAGPLELVKCRDEHNKNVCGLLQLRHSYDCRQMYGNNYGYRSGLNKSMVKHLREKAVKIESFIRLKPKDLVVDIGSNDGTLLRAYHSKGLLLAGIDPTGKKFKKYYPQRSHLIPDFFSEGVLKKKFGNKKARVVTSIAMFYDLESPVDFAGQIKNILADDGIWLFEQSYMPKMLEMNAYDTVCHEHLEYYCLKQIKWITDKAGLKIIDIEFNKANGGSFCVIAARRDSKHKENSVLIQKLLLKENKMRLNTLHPYDKFRQRIMNNRVKVLNFIRKANSENKKIFGYGASTKGNVLLQYCNLSDKDISCIAEVNPDKFGCFTSGTLIPIVPEEQARKMKPDYFMVLPWHFRDTIIESEKEYLVSGGKLFFPLPNPVVV